MACLSPSVASRLKAAGVDRDVRGWEKASDHAPVWIKLTDAAAERPKRTRRLSARQGGEARGSNKPTIGFHCQSIRYWCRSSGRPSRVNIEPHAPRREASEAGDATHATADDFAKENPAVERPGAGKSHPCALGQLVAEQAAIAALERQRRVTLLGNFRLIDDLKPGVAKPAQEIEGKELVVERSRTFDRDKWRRVGIEQAEQAKNVSPLDIDL
jgi:hypothetical protein